MRTIKVAGPDDDAKAGESALVLRQGIVLLFNPVVLVSDEHRTLGLVFHLNGLRVNFKKQGLSVEGD
jgi:hypothetical protein